MKKLTINPESITNSLLATKQFDEVLKKAKEGPQFIAENDKVELAIIDYALYEKMYLALELLQEVAWEAEIVRRIEHADAHPEDLLTLEEALGKEAAERILQMDPDEVADNELFE